VDLAKYVTSDSWLSAKGKQSSIYAIHCCPPQPVFQDLQDC